MPPHPTTISAPKTSSLHLADRAGLGRALTVAVAVAAGAAVAAAAGGDDGVAALPAALVAAGA